MERTDIRTLIGKHIIRITVADDRYVHFTLDDGREIQAPYDTLFDDCGMLFDTSGLE